MTASAPKHCNTCHREYRAESDFLTNTSRWRVCTTGHLWFNCSCGSTLMIPKGKYGWYSPELFLSEDARSIFNKLGNLKDLPHIPSIVMEIQMMLQDPETTPKALAAAMRQEPILATQLLQTAENLRRARNPANPPLRALEHAIVYVGHKVMRDLVMSSALRALPLPESGFRAQEFWDESYLTGAIAENLVARFKLTLAVDEIYLSGSLCNIGKLVLAFCFPPLATKIAHDTHDRKIHMTWRMAERAYQFPDHGILGEIAASFWGLPDFVMQVSRRHHDLPSTNYRALETVSIVAFANQLSHYVLSNPHRIEQDVMMAHAKRYGLDEKQLETLAAELVGVRQAVLGR